MKNLVLLACCLLVLPFSTFAQTEQATDSHIEAAHRLLDNMNMQETLDKTIDATLTAQLSQMPQLKNVEGVMREFFAKYMNYEILREEYTAIYVKHYTESELDELYTFYQTPLGKKMVKKTPEITAESSMMGQNLVQEHMAELQEAIMKKMSEEGGN